MKTINESAVGKNEQLVADNVYNALNNAFEKMKSNKAWPPSESYRDLGVTRSKKFFRNYKDFLDNNSFCNVAHTGASSYSSDVYIQLLLENPNARRMQQNGFYVMNVGIEVKNDVRSILFNPSAKVDFYDSGLPSIKFKTNQPISDTYGYMIDPNQRYDNNLFMQDICGNTFGNMSGFETFQERLDLIAKILQIKQLPCDVSTEQLNALFLPENKKLLIDNGMKFNKSSITIMTGENNSNNALKWYFYYMRLENSDKQKYYPVKYIQIGDYSAYSLVDNTSDVTSFNVGYNDLVNVTSIDDAFQGFKVSWRLVFPGSRYNKLHLEANVVLKIKPSNFSFTDAFSTNILSQVFDETEPYQTKRKKNVKYGTDMRF